MEKEIIFNNITKPFGGRLTSKNEVENAIVINGINMLTYYSKDPNLIKPFPKIIYDFVNSEDFNAFAMKSTNEYIIGINEAVILILFNLFNRMLACNDVLVHIGDSSEEDYSKTVNDYYVSTKDLITKGYGGKYESIEPKNKLRKYYAIHLTKLAMEFIFEHELSHILFGHVDYLNAKYGIRTYSEFNFKNVINADNLDIQTLEMDADCTALARCCALAKRRVDNPNMVYSEFQIFYKNLYDSFSDIDFAICNVFRLFGDGDYQNVEPGKSSHPDPQVRQFSLLSTYYSIIENWQLDIDYKILFEKLIVGLKESHRAYEKLTGKKINLELYRPEFYVEHPLNNALRDNWENRMRNELLVYTFKPLAN